MSIAVKFYTFSKKPNSLKTPAANVGTTYNCELLDDCSIMNPKIILKGNPMTSYLGSYNYAYISEFGNRYYFISDSVYCAEDGFWHITMSVDVLGSRATAIRNTNQYIERCATGYNLDVADSTYPSKATPEYVDRKYSAFFNSTPQNGQYIIGMISKSASARFGGVAYYLMDSTMMNALVAYMMNLSNYADSSITGIATELLGMIGEPLQFIVSCKFFPRKFIDTTGMTPTPVYFGANQAMNVTGYPITESFLNPSPVVSDGFTIEVVDHPEVVTRGIWLNANSHTRRVLRFEPWGCIPIDSSKLVGFSRLACAIDVDIISGAAILSLYASNQNWEEISDVTSLPLIGTYPTNLLVDIPLSQYRHEGYLKAAVNTFVKPMSDTSMSAITGFFGGGIFGAVGGAAQGLNNQYWSAIDGMQNFFGPPSSQGTPGSLLSRVPVILSSMFLRLVGEDLGEFGRPCCESRSINNMLGYTKCKGAIFESDLTKEENEKIITHLNSGFYVE